MFLSIDPNGPRVHQCSVAPTFSELLLQTTTCAYVGIDIPIGLPGKTPRGGRGADRAARELLRPKRHASVFNTPPRAVLQARSYGEANELHRANSEGEMGMSRQAYGLLPKIAEVDDLMTPRLQKRIFEAHPELSFMELNGGKPLALSKTKAGGQLARMRLLAECGLTDGLEAITEDLGGTRLDDLLDAAAVAWTAARFLRGEAERAPDEPELDVRGLRMEMWR